MFPNVLRYIGDIPGISYGFDQKKMVDLCGLKFFTLEVRILIGFSANVYKINYKVKRKTFERHGCLLNFNTMKRLLKNSLLDYDSLCLNFPLSCKCTTSFL